MAVSTKFQNGSLMLVKNKTAPASWFFRYREELNGRTVRRNIRIGSIQELPTKKAAELAVSSLRFNINSEVRTPNTVADLAAHYEQHELTAEDKSHATIENFKGNLRLHILPKWGDYRLYAVKPVEVEQWLRKLPLAPLTRSKIKNQMLTLFFHAMRFGWLLTEQNPISTVRCSSRRLREPDVLTPAEFHSLLPYLAIRERAMVMLVGTTGLRRSEMFALKWSDISFATMEVSVTKGVVRGHFGSGKSPASRKPVPLVPVVAEVLLKWRAASPYKADTDFLFPSIQRNGTQPLYPDMVFKNYVRPALDKAGIVGKKVGWHTFRHSFATNLFLSGAGIKTAQDLLRHASSRTTLDIYTRGVSAEKRRASQMQCDLLMGGSNGPSIGPQDLEAAA